jgi:hypothetical protein
VDLTPLIDRLSTMSADELIKAVGIKTCEPLKSNLKLYLEYSNETWNGSFKQAHYCVEEGTALNLDPKGERGKDGKIWVNGFKFHPWAAIRIFRAADLVYGVGSPRVVRVLALQVGSAWQAERHLQVMKNEVFNPWGTKADAIAVAPYFGAQVMGDDPQAIPKLREAIKKSCEEAAKVAPVVKEAGLRYIAYEGGQHVFKRNAQIINRDASMHDLYLEYLSGMSKYFDFFCHYAHVGKAGHGGAWGCIEYTGQPLAEAHKYRALQEWIQSNPHQAADLNTTKNPN